MWEGIGMVHLHWNWNNYNDDSNTRQKERVERVSTLQPAGGSLPLAPIQNWFARAGWRQWRTAGAFWAELVWAAG